MTVDTQAHRTPLSLRKLMLRTESGSGIVFYIPIPFPVQLNQVLEVTELLLLKSLVTI